MKLFRRRHGSKRAMAPITLELHLNVTGDPELTFLGSDGLWYIIAPETEQEMKRLLSEAHVVHHNWPDRVS